MRLNDGTEQLRISTFTKQLLSWWATNKRAFAWRDRTDPYEIVIAELFLRRTNAPAVQPVYIDFLQKYPSPQALANGSSEAIEKIVLRLGLNWRARNVVELAEWFRRAPAIPETLPELLELPGVGPYVARAVLVNSFGSKITPVDSNVVRVICRYLGLTPSDTLRRRPDFQQLADSFCANVSPRDFNHALLDFSSLVCTPRSPRCPICPVSASCLFANRMRPIRVRSD